LNAENISRHLEWAEGIFSTYNKNNVPKYYRGSSVIIGAQSFLDLGPRAS